jgi:hypothetical protein
MTCPKCKGPTMEYIPFLGPAEMICADESNCTVTVRHTYASHLRLMGVPLEDIKELLGHSSLQVPISARISLRALQRR